MGKKTIKARILDLRETVDAGGHSHLVLEFEDGGQISAPIPDDAEDWEDSVPDLVEALRQRGYAFAGEPTGDCGPVELVHI